MNKYIVYTDGGCRLHKNRRRGAWAAVIISPDGEITTMSGTKTPAQSSGMELIAVINALNAIPNGAEVTIISDYKMISEAINEKFIYEWALNDWHNCSKDYLCHNELWQQLLLQMGLKKVNTLWVKGHNDDYFNEMCDEMCTSEILKG